MEGHDWKSSTITASKLSFVISTALPEHSLNNKYSFSVISMALPTWKARSLAAAFSALGLVDAFHQADQRLPVDEFVYLWKGGHRLTCFAPAAVTENRIHQPELSVHFLHEQT
jgi:hypothetical protein